MKVRGSAGTRMSTSTSTARITALAIAAERYFHVAVLKVRKIPTSTKESEGRSLNETE